MPRQERAERTRIAILDAAATEFDQHGYEGARLDRIVERTGATKGAVYFHFRSKLDIATALVEESEGNWPAVVHDVAASGLRGLAAAEEVTQRVAAVLGADIRARAAMKLTQTVLPPAADDDPYARWVAFVAGLLRQEAEDRRRSDVEVRDLATVAVHGLFGAYTIAAERNTFETLSGDIARVWGVVTAAFGTL